MIIHTKESANIDRVQQLAKATQSVLLQKDERYILVTPSKMQNPPSGFDVIIDQFWPMSSDLQLGSRAYLNQTREVALGEVTIGGSTSNRRLLLQQC